MATTTEILKDLTELDTSRAKAQEKVDTNNTKRDEEIAKIREKFEKSGKSAKDELNLILTDIKAKTKELQKATSGASGSTTSGNGRKPRSPNLPPLEVTDDEVAKFVNGSKDEFSAGDLREHFNVPDSHKAKFSALLTGLLNTEQIGSNGLDKAQRRYKAK